MRRDEALARAALFLHETNPGLHVEVLAEKAIALVDLLWRDEVFVVEYVDPEAHPDSPRTVDSLYLERDAAEMRVLVLSRLPRAAESEGCEWAVGEWKLL